MVMYFLSAILNTKYWRDGHINCRVSFSPSFLKRSHTVCKQVYIQFRHLRQCLYVFLDIEQSYVFENYILENAEFPMYLQFGGVEQLQCFLLDGNVERCEEENLSLSYCLFFSLSFLTSNLLIPPKVTSSCFPLNIFYKTPFPTRHVPEDLPHQPASSSFCWAFQLPLSRPFHCRLHLLTGRRSCDVKHRFLLPVQSWRSQKGVWD